MYLLIDLFKNIPAGEPVVIRSDRLGGIGAFCMNGEKVGELSGVQPEGCAEYHKVIGYLCDNRIFGKIAIKNGNSAFLYANGVCLDQPLRQARITREGYGMLVSVAR